MMRGTGLQFCQNWGRHEMSRWKQYTGRKTGPNLFSDINWSLRECTPGFGFALPVPSFDLFIFFIKSSLVRIKILWNLVNCYPVSLNTTTFLTLLLHSNWGWNRDYVIKLGLKYKVTSRKHFENFGYSQWGHFPNQVYNSNSTHTKYLGLQHYSYP
jgi:hypothetical protein